MGSINKKLEYINRKKRKGDYMVSKEQALDTARQMGIKFDKFSFDDFYTGLNIELEHGLKNPATNITNDNLIMTAKIALAHLNEFSNYYNKDYGLPALEKRLNS